MAEEKNEGQADKQEAPKPVEAPQKVAASPEIQGAPAVAKEEKAAPVKVERPANCVGCKKSIKKRWYYRDGNYYCTKRCWSTVAKKAAKTEEAPAAS